METKIYLEPNPEFPIVKEISLEEKVNLEYVKVVVENFDRLAHLVGSCFDLKTLKRMAQSGTKKCLEDFFRARKKGHKVLYKPSKDSQDGRLYSKNGLSLQGMARQTRHLISKDDSYDLDFVNCHPKILLWILKKENIKCEQLENYVRNRQKCLDELMSVYNLSKDEVKTGLLAIMNGGSGASLETKPETPQWLITFRDEIEKAQQQIAKLNPKLTAKVKKIRGEEYFNVNGSVMNRILCKYENILMQICFQYAEKNGIKVKTLCFDGFMVYKETVPNLDEFISNLNKYLAERAPGMEMEVVNKPMDEGEELLKEVLKIMEEPEVSNLEDPKGEEVDGLLWIGDILENDEECAKVILEELKKKKNILNYSERDLYYIWNEDTKLFAREKKEKLMIFFSDILCPLVQKKLDNINSNITLLKSQGIQTSFWTKKREEYKKKYNSFKNSSTQRNILAQVMNRLEKDDDFIILNLDRKSELFPIADNKVVDFRTGKIRERIREDYFTKTTDNIYIPKDKRREKEVDEYIMSILNTTNRKYIEFIYYLIAYFMTGLNHKKCIIFIIGPGNTGKTQFVKLVNSILGSFRVEASKNVFVESKNQSVATSELYPLVNMRLATIVELSGASTFRVDLIKRITGNDVEISARKCGEEQETIRIDCKLMVALNDENVPQFNDKQFAERIITIPFNTKFEKNEAEAIRILGLKNDLFSICVDYAKKFFDNKMNFEFPQEVLRETNNRLKELDSVKSFFEEHYEMTESRLDRVNKPEMAKKYEFYCKDNKFESIGRNKFLARIKDEYNLTIWQKSFFERLKERVSEEIKLKQEEATYDLEN